MDNKSINQRQEKALQIPIVLSSLESVVEELKISFEELKIRLISVSNNSPRGHSEGVEEGTSGTCEVSDRIEHIVIRLNDLKRDIQSTTSDLEI